MNELPLADGCAAKLRDILASSVVLPGETGYERGRAIWNADIDRFPSAIVRCRDASEVQQAFAACREHGLDFTVRGGGHSVAGMTVEDGSVMIDLGLLNEVNFDDAAGTVTVGAGCVWGDVDRPAADREVVVPSGVVSHTGVAGLTLGGGTGYLGRLHGPTVDHLLGVDIVTADGRLLHASAEEHPDLFWAVRGAGHNYGIVTSFTFRPVALQTRANVHQAFFAADDRRTVMQYVGEHALSAPDELTAYTRLLAAPPYWSQVPTPHRGRPIVSLAIVHYGEPAAARRLWAPFAEVANPIWETSYSLPHVELQHACDDEFHYGARHYWKPLYLQAVTDDVMDVAIEWADRYPGPLMHCRSKIPPQMMCPFEFLTLGGQRGRVDAASMSMSGRDALYAANIGADWLYPEEAPELLAWARAFADALEPHAAGSYVNFTSVQGDGSLAQAIYGDNYERLVDVKREYDPENVFRRGLMDLTPTVVDPAESGA